MNDGAVLSLAALGIAALCYIAGIVYALRADHSKAAALIIVGAALTVASMF